MSFVRELIVVILMMFSILALTFAYLLLSGIKDKFASTYCKKCKGFSKVDKQSKCKVCGEALEIDSQDQLSVFGYDDLKRKDGNVNVIKCVIAAIGYIIVPSIFILITVNYILYAY